nr:hypothetical protein [uncultured Faecalimonas sp.]
MLNREQFESYRQEKKEWEEKKKGIALEVVELFKSENLSVSRIDEVMRYIENIVKCRARL